MKNSCFARVARAVFIFVHFAVILVLAYDSRAINTAILVLLTTCSRSQIFPALLSDINGLQQEPMSIGFWLQQLPEAVLGLNL